MNVPEGYQAITPYFTVADADTFIEFLIEVFDGTLLVADRYLTGGIQHARVRINDSVIMINESNEQYQANVSQMHLYVESVEATYTRALAAGAVLLMEPNVRPHGDRMAGFTDPCGNIWWIARYKEG